MCVWGRPLAKALPTTRRKPPSAAVVGVCGGERNCLESAVEGNQKAQLPSKGALKLNYFHYFAPFLSFPSIQGKRDARSLSLTLNYRQVLELETFPGPSPTPNAPPPKAQRGGIWGSPSFDS